MSVKAIYKITNKINNKSYIGQSNNPKARWGDHINGSGQNAISLIHRAIEKYGKQNFSFEIIGWFEDYNEQEKYYIKYYNTLAPNGYNIQPGGEEPPHYCGEKNSFAKISKETAYRVQQQALNWDIPGKHIIKQNNITPDIFRHIVAGDTWRRDDLTYPLRPGESVLNAIKAHRIICLLKYTNMTHREIGELVGWSKSAVTMINIGKNHCRANESYPIRK